MLFQLFVTIAKGTWKVESSVQCNFKDGPRPFSTNAMNPLAASGARLQHIYITQLRLSCDTLAKQTMQKMGNHVRKTTFYCENFVKIQSLVIPDMFWVSVGYFDVGSQFIYLVPGVTLYKMYAISNLQFRFYRCTCPSYCNLSFCHFCTHPIENISVIAKNGQQNIRFGS